MSVTFMRSVSGLAAGVLLGAGLLVSGMVDPGKVLGFLVISPDWNPALIGVLGGAVVVSMIGFQLFFPRMLKPLFEPSFVALTRRDIDRPLLVGSALFGLGWGLAGYCPGPALAGLALGNAEAPVFLLFMLLGGVLQKRWAERAGQ